jgi:hypothetical protein
MEVSNNQIRVALYKDKAGRDLTAEQHALARYMKQQMQNNIDAGNINATYGGKIELSDVKKVINKVATIGSYIPHPAVAIPSMIIKGLTGGFANVSDISNQNTLLDAARNGQITAEEFARLSALAQYQHPALNVIAVSHEPNTRIARIKQIYERRGRETDLTSRPTIRTVSSDLVGGSCGGCGMCPAARNAAARKIMGY